MAAARRSPPMALAGVGAVVLGALIFLGAHLGIDRRQTVLVVARPVAPGQVIEGRDLRTARMTVSDAAGSVPAARQGQVVGKTAAVGLVPGGVLAPGQVGPVSSLEAGQAVVAVPIKPGQAPPGLRAGTRVQVVDTGGSAAGEALGPSVVSTQAVVSDVSISDTGSVLTVVALRVPSDDATGVAAAGSAGRVSLVVVPES